MYRIGGLIMNIGSSTPLQLTPLKEFLSINDLRTLVAKQLRVDIEFVTSETHFANNLGADLLEKTNLLAWKSRTMMSSRYKSLAISYGILSARGWVRSCERRNLVKG
jgi:hypothetical protein